MNTRFILFRFFNYDDCHRYLGTIFEEDDILYIEHFTLVQLLQWHNKLNIPGSWKLEISQNNSYEADFDQNDALKPYLIPWYASGMSPMPYWGGPIEIHVVFDNVADAALYKLLS